MNATLLELIREKHFALEPGYFIAARNRILADPSGRSFEAPAKDKMVKGMFVFHGGSVTDTFSSGKVWMGNADYISRYRELDDDDCIVNVVRITSAITRGGGECSYGSIEIRDMIMEAADVDQCIAHILYTRTPGGSADALRDFRMAIDYAHSKGQKVYMFADGNVASCGVFLGCMCDGIYFFNPEDEIGSIGMYSAFFTLADGARNSITRETYREYYASKSPEKNKFYRDAAKGKMETLAKETEAYLDALLENLKKDRPSVKPEQMKGAMYKMKDVIGTLVDGQSTMDALAMMIYDEWSKNNSPVSSGNQQSNNNNGNMSKQYIQLSAFIGSQVALECDKNGGVYLQPHQADALEEKIPLVAGREIKLTNAVRDLETQLNEARALVASLTAERDKLAGQVNDFTQTETVTMEQHNAVKQELETARDEATRLAAEKADLTTRLEQAEKDLTDSNQAVSDLTEKLTQLESGPGASASHGDSPRNNGLAPSAPHLDAAPKWDASLSVKENRERFEAYKKKLQKLAAQ